MYKEIKFTREQIYRKVWEQPVLVIAKEIGVSDVALAKACRKAGVPLPNRGHWAILKSGRTIKAPLLPALRQDQADSICFTVLENPLPKQPKVEIPAGPLIEIPPELIRPHRLIAELKSATKDGVEYKGVLPLNYQKFLRVRTSSAQLQRALILMDTLIKQFEDRGYKVRISEKNAETELVLKEGNITFRLDERTKQVPPPPPPPRPSGRRGEYYSEPWLPAYLLAGTGEFTLAFSGGIHNCRNTWKDRNKALLEAQLHEVMAAIPSWQAALLANRIEREERSARAHEEEQRRIVAARAQEILRLQRVKLVENLRSWEHAERLRRFIVAFEQKGDQSPEAVAWLEWANLQVQALDPLFSDLKVVTDPRVELSEYYTGRNSWDKQVMDWWGIDPTHKRSMLGVVDEPESGRSDDLVTTPAWHPNRWYTKLHR